MSKLIRGIRESQIVNPEVMLMFSLPKAGKTHALTHLPNHLILDFDPREATRYYRCNSVYIPDLNTYSELRKELKEDGHKFDYLIIDTITSAMDSIVRPLAVFNWNKEQKQEDKRPLSWDITTLEWGAGWGYLREALKQIVKQLVPFGKYIIFTAHTGDKYIKKKGEELTVKTVDLPGKLKNIFAVSSDAICTFYREDGNKCVMNFTHDEEEQEAGTRSPHLRNKIITVSEFDEEKQVLTTHWDRIFLEEGLKTTVDVTSAISSLKEKKSPKKES